jgi:hypothetical protein
LAEIEVTRRGPEITSPHVLKPGDVVCMIPGPNVELARRPDRIRWCFACRQRTAHDIVVFGDAEPSYYDPIAIRQCSRCGRDSTAFPG